MTILAGPWPETPTTGHCCEGSAYQGAGGCTCWTPVYDLDQAEPDSSLDATIRPRMCVDCAFRPGSPERSGHPDAVATADGLNALVESGTPFWCHQGIRRPIRWEHPSGSTMPGSPMDYRPPTVDQRPYKADGTPADYCAGWASRWLKAVWRAQK